MTGVQGSYWKLGDGEVSTLLVLLTAFLGSSHLLYLAGEEREEIGQGKLG